MTAIEQLNAHLSKTDAILRAVEAALAIPQEPPRCGNCEVFDAEPNAHGDGYCLGHRGWIAAGHVACEEWKEET